MQFNNNIKFISKLTIENSQDMNNYILCKYYPNLQFLNLDIKIKLKPNIRAEFIKLIYRIQKYKYSLQDIINISRKIKQSATTFINLLLNIKNYSDIKLLKDEIIYYKDEKKT